MLTRAFNAGYETGLVAMRDHWSSAWPDQPANPYKRVHTMEAWAQGFKHAVAMTRAERESLATA